MDAFEDILSEKTFDDITVNELCQKALIRRPTFYSHFEDKYDFLRFYFNEIQTQIESEADEVSSDMIGHFAHSWSSLIRFVDVHPELIRVGLKSTSLPLMFDILTEHIFASSQSHFRDYLSKNRPDLLGYADTVSAFVVGGIIQNLKRYLYGECKNAESLSNEMVFIFESLWRSILAS
ncbi:MAG: TetR/AcrR family transcriptional regulator [Oscillospiraceae bacterium]